MAKHEFKVPELSDVSDENREILQGMEKQIGFVPNIYATYAYSNNALKRFTELSAGKTSLNNKEKQLVNLVVSQVNGCTYCQAAHTAAGKMAGFDEDQILEIRRGSASFDPKLDALAKTARAIIENRGKVDDQILEEFFAAGYARQHLVDLIVDIGEKTITNFLHNVTDIPLDFPEAPELKAETAH